MVMMIEIQAWSLGISCMQGKSAPSEQACPKHHGCGCSSSPCSVRTEPDLATWYSFSCKITKPRKKWPLQQLNLYLENIVILCCRLTRAFLDVFCENGLISLGDNAYMGFAMKYMLNASSARLPYKQGCHTSKVAIQASYREARRLNEPAMVTNWKMRRRRWILRLMAAVIMRLVVVHSASRYSVVKATDTMSATAGKTHRAHLQHSVFQSFEHLFIHSLMHSVNAVWCLCCILTSVNDSILSLSRSFLDSLTTCFIHLFVHYFVLVLSALRYIHTYVLLPVCSTTDTTMCAC